MKNITILGSGMIGRAIAWDLSHDYYVRVVDKDTSNLNKIREVRTVERVQGDLKDADFLAKQVADADLVVGAVPGFMGFKTLKSVLEAGKPIVDISFFPEDPFALDTLAKQKGLTAIVDCGVAPGLSHLLAGRWNEALDLTHFECLVGGLPQVRSMPFQYKAPFSPIDVIEEYTRPARIKVDGQVITLPALTNREEVDFERVGTLEAFNTDGLRTLLNTLPNVPHLLERTLRYPGHIDLILQLKKAGFFDSDPILLGEAAVSPLEFTARMLTDNWLLGDDEPELTVMRIILEGSGRKLQADLYDVFDAKTGFSSMARTTGFTCTAACRLVLEHGFEQSGIIPPEWLGVQEEHYDFMLKHLAHHNINLSWTEL